MTLPSSLKSVLIAAVFGAGLLVAALARRPLGGETIDAGGPDLLDLNALLVRIRLAQGGRAGPFVHLPVGPIRSLLALLEPLLFPLLPFTAGQLASFVNDGTARPSVVGAQLHRPTRDLATMLATKGHDD